MKKNTTMDAYIRVSRVAGRDKKNGGESFHSPEEQEEGIHRWAAQNGVTIGEVITELDVSGGKAAMERGLGKLVERCQDGQSSGIVVYSFSRFTREHPYRAVDVLRLLDECQPKARLVSVMEGFDSSTPSGVLLVGVLVQAAQTRQYR